MSKSVSDVLGRIQGNLLALQGMIIKLAPPPSLPSAPNTTFEQMMFPSGPPPLPNTEDYAYVKKLVEDIKGLCQSVADGIDAALHTEKLAKDAAAEAAAAPSSSSGSAKTK